MVCLDGMDPIATRDRKAQRKQHAEIVLEGMRGVFTSAANAPWPLDCPITDLAAAGLPAPSKVRFKLLTLDHRLVRGVLGALSPADSRTVSDALGKLLGAAS